MTIAIPVRDENFPRSQAPAWECISLLIIYMKVFIDVCIPNEDIGNEDK